MATFEIRRQPVDVTSWHRPDTEWMFTDKAGHPHAWHVNGAPATSYSPMNRHSLPTLNWIVDFHGDDELPESGHYECTTCGERVTPGYTADAHEQFIPGMPMFYVDCRRVSENEFRRQAREELVRQGLDPDAYLPAIR